MGGACSIGAPESPHAHQHARDSLVLARHPHKRHLLPIKLYAFPFSKSSQVALIAALESGIPIEMHSVERPAFEVPRENNGGAGYADDIISVRVGSRRLPAMVDPNEGDFEVSESRAISNYFAMRYSDPDTLVPADVRKRVRMEQLISIEYSHFGPALNKVIGTIIGHALHCNEVDEGLIVSTFNDENFLHAIDMLEASLKVNGGLFLLGEKFTLADVVYAPYFFWYDSAFTLQPALLSKHPKSKFFNDESEFPYLKKWWSAVYARLSMQIVVAESNKAFKISLDNVGRAMGDRKPHALSVEYKM